MGFRMETDMEAAILHGVCQDDRRYGKLQFPQIGSTCNLATRGPKVLESPLKNIYMSSFSSVAACTLRKKTNK